MGDPTSAALGSVPSANQTSKATPEMAYVWSHLREDYMCGSRGSSGPSQSRVVECSGVDCCGYCLCFFEKRICFFRVNIADWPRKYDSICVQPSVVLQNTLLSYAARCCSGNLELK
jgi:hypothetical protein